MARCWKCETNRPHPFHDDGQQNCSDNGTIMSLLRPTWIDGQWQYPENTGCTSSSS